MGEPLKDKTKELGSALPKEDRIKYHEDKDIKSAVEWLKKKVIHCRENDEETQYDIDTIQELIDQAFPDLQDVSKTKTKKKRNLNHQKLQKG